MTWQQILGYVLWLGPLPFLAAVAIAMQRRHLVRIFPVFFTLILLDLVSFSTSWFVAHRPGGAYLEYFISSWAMTILKTLLRFAVLYEVFRHTFQEYEGLRRFSRLLFQWGAVALLGTAIVAAAVAPGQGLGKIVGPVLVLERSFAIVQVGLLLLLFISVRYMRLEWPHHTFGIALGIGVYTGISLAATGVMTAMGYDDASSMFRFVKPGAHMCAVLLWAAYFVPAYVPATTPAAVPRHSLQRWNEALQQFLQR
jgi:hypothetical protein